MTYWLARGDLSQIEARVLPWLAGAEWKLDAFRAYDAGTGPDLYRVAAAGVLQRPIDEITGPLRQVYGKVSELALGFQGGANALQQMARGYGAKIPWHPRLPSGRVDMDAPVETGSDEWIKRRWREANPEIVQMWKDAGNAAVTCVASPPGQAFPFGDPARGLSFRRSARTLALTMPSGRPMLYWFPRLARTQSPYGERWAVRYRAEDSQTKQWREWSAYGGLFCQGPTQATARDVLRGAFLRAEALDYRPVLTVHDELICELSREQFPAAAEAAEAVRAVMVGGETWTAGLPIAADASAGDRYVKG